MGWVWMASPNGEPVRFPDDPAVIAQQEALGLQQVDDPGASPESGEVEPDEVDVHGQGWVYLTHADTGGAGRFPVEVAGDMYDQGWASPAEAQAAELEEQTKADLQDQLRERGLPVSGTKQELIDRLAEADQAPVEPTEPEEQ